MKKILGAVLTVAMLASMSTMAFADTITAVDGTSSKDVLAKISDKSTKDTVYSVDVEWGAMEFTYEKSGSMAWNPADHTYTQNTTSAWDINGSDVTVTNHSNAPVNVALSFEKDASITEAITGAFDKASMSLPSAEGKETDAAELTQTAYLSLNLPLSALGTEFEKVGTVTVSLN